jgi:anti-anti-sigma regulatory factor
MDVKEKEILPYYMEITIRDGVATVAFIGDLGLPIWDDFKMQVRTLAADKIILDFSRASKVSICVIGMMLNLRDRCHKEIQVKCCNELRAFFECMECDQLFSCSCAIDRKTGFFNPH